ncbi:MAG: 16S rRNA (guanine(527)-N(7))-methyltransferase RsmG [Candidatus Sericytochromatia bacterium]|nr:16S rRNA (guanine(527)-N(7))-methyltransferase RsmG [Candidatus Sericytochromatia bacterium]
MSHWPHLQRLAAAYELNLNEAELSQFSLFHRLLIAANERVNLTRIVEADEAAVKHYLDSLLFLKGLPPEGREGAQRVVDIGAGAGLPGIPLAIVRPDWHITLVDAVRKKVDFMNTAIAELGLSNAVALHGRSETLAAGPPHRDSYDLALARAVAGLPELLELTLPFLRSGGRLVVSKGSKGPEELAGASKALSRLRGRVLAAETFDLPAEAGQRHLYVIEKHGATPAGFPRKAGTPHRQPLV